MKSTERPRTGTKEFPLETLDTTGRSSWAERSAWIVQLGNVLGEHATEMERAIAIDTEKLRPDAAAEVRATVEACTFYGLNAQHWTNDWLSAGHSPGVVIAETPIGNALWRLTRLALPVLLGGGALMLARTERSATTVDLLARAVGSAGFVHGSVTVCTEEPRPVTDVRVRRATYNYGAHPSDSPAGLSEPTVVAGPEGVDGLARRAVRRAGSPGSPVPPTVVRLVATPSMHDELCRAVAHAVREAPAVSWRSSPVAGGDGTGNQNRVPLVLVDVAHDIESALDRGQGTAFGLQALLGGPGRRGQPQRG